MCRILKLLKFFRKTRSAGQFLKIDFFIFLIICSYFLF
ncbi:hypothetical protein BafPKo_0492 [Borreliella afzelii PKo]|uniref:Uncharacterized protein n=1 Tax=Borreliella afzelii (strain PKo) TaxID=390236 RepID=G0ISB9_BORAP|nr:hypothetical protein BafPKo_0492 [Borreliella afzelii PKo]